MKVGVGYSEIPNAGLAADEAVRAALKQAGRSDTCDMVLLFCTARHDQESLRDAVARAVGYSVPIYGGGAVGVITNDFFGYAGDQVGVALLWLEDSSCDVLIESGLAENESDTGRRLGKRLAEIGTAPDSPVMLFYDAVDRSGGDVRLLMATWLLAGLEQGLGFLPGLAGAGMQGDHICSPTNMFTGQGLSTEQSVLAMRFSKDINLDTAIMHGCRPASQYYTVTKAEGPVILEINGEPAIPFLDAMLGPSITPEQYPFFLMFGINHGEPWGEYDENNYASRLCLGLDPARNGIVMFEPDMQAGTSFQLMFRSLDLDYMKPKIEELFERLDGREPLFAMYIDCAGRCAGYGGVDMEDAIILQQTVGGRVPLLGLYTGVEIAPMGGKSRGLDWTGVFCLFSRGKDGDIKASPAQPSWESHTPSPVNHEVDVNALLGLCTQNAAKVLALDTQTIALRHELEHKRRGFALLAELAISLRQKNDLEWVFLSVASRLGAALNMQRTAVLVPEADGRFLPMVMQGYSEEEKAQMRDRPIQVPQELLETPLLITAADDPSRFADLRAALGIPYFVAAPVIVKNEIEAILLTGRLVEQTPFLSRLGASDTETVQAISALLSSVLIRQQLDEAEDRAHLMLDSTPLCANFWNSDFQNIDCNLEALNLFGLSTKQEYLSRFWELSPPYQPDGSHSATAAQAHILQAFREGRCVFEWVHQTLDGEQIPTEIILVRVRYKNEDVVIGYTRDLRELKAKMAEIERTQEDLRKAKDLAEESSRAKTNFLANMSHEIRTPMNAIIGMTEIARHSQDPEQVQYCLSKIDSASTHLLGIINDILDMSKIDAGKLILSPSDFVIEEMLRGVINVSNFKIEEKHQSFFIQVDRDVPDAIITDNQRLSQVLVNLLSNAVKFTSENGNISLRILLAAQQGDEVTLQFEVSDDGIGISQDQQENLFQSFQQADGSISRRFGGTGLGLAISKEIVSKMGGKIWVESEPGQGSTFRFIINAKQGHAKKSHRLRTALRKKNIRILAVDDAPDVLLYFDEISTDLGITCKTASSGQEALRILESGEQFHIVFVDWSMPEMDGIELSRRIREFYGDHMVVVMISAVSWNEIEEEATAAGIQKFIAKPLLPSLIVDCVNECLELDLIEGIHEEKAGLVTESIFAGKHILLAEDNEINREIVAALLADTGALIEMAENGVLACALFEENPARYDVILMDIQMPELDGYGAARAIRAMEVPRAKTIPIIAMTANVFREDIENCLAAGMNDHIGKPLDVDDVIKKLKKHLQ